MKALTLHDPWGWAIREGFKRFETRSWKPAQRPPFDLAIHVAARIPAYARETARYHEPIAAVLRQCGYDIDAPIPWLGCILCVVQVVAVHRTEDARERGLISTEESAWGDYSRGRWAWELTNIRPVEPPLPARGYQFLWDVDLPARQQQRTDLARSAQLPLLEVPS